MCDTTEFHFPSMSSQTKCDAAIGRSQEHLFLQHITMFKMFPEVRGTATVSHVFFFYDIHQMQQSSTKNFAFFRRVSSTTCVVSFLFFYWRGCLLCTKPYFAWLMEVYVTRSLQSASEKKKLVNCKLLQIGKSIDTLVLEWILNGHVWHRQYRYFSIDVHITSSSSSRDGHSHWVATGGVWEDDHVQKSQSKTPTYMQSYWLLSMTDASEIKSSEPSRLIHCHFATLSPQGCIHATELKSTIFEPICGLVPPFLTKLP